MVGSEGQANELVGKPARRARWWVWLAGVLVVLLIGAIAWVWIATRQSAPREAPETEAILAAQAGLPFQVLIPAYLPAAFDRARIQIDTAQTSLAGEPTLQLTYPTRQGYSIVLREWLSGDPQEVPTGAGTGTLANPRTIQCRCQCRSRTQCSIGEIEVSIGALHVSLQLSAPNLLSMNEVQLILNTLGPAANRLVYSSIDDVPVSFKVPEAVVIPVNAEGVQELTLVVTPQGYTPAHFQVKPGVPVKLIFRQLGQVGCGNQLVFAWEADQSVTLTLASPDDTQSVEFTPQQSGDFPFQCPHQIYQGVMTVK